MSSVRRAPCSHDWLRTLVLLLALLVPGAHFQAHAMPPVPAGELVEYDVLDTPVRWTARAVHRTAVPLRPAPRPETAPGVPAYRPRAGVAAAAVRAARPAFRGPALLTEPASPGLLSTHARNTVMSKDPYAILRALLRAEAARSAPKPQSTKKQPPLRAEKRG
ncbi:hypothetical protein M2158_004215 [Streptomyces sp. SAI-144]|uniref:hypothetical protein n=1 Tax=Streptomyces sp. SAI-144 TaxID=2940544 RepID=UPI002473972D|nr:hypothetical protein [Streptomyces sp. SAI-144]MDH6435738.1 hypothetical protein [Streptomyces sp. SAI-144]